MELKRKRLIVRRKERYEQELRDRLGYLSGKGVGSPKADKDTIVKKLKAEIKGADKNLRLIAGHEKRTEEMAKAKAEKAAAPKMEPEARKSEKPKKPEEGKAKKPKPEKPAGAPKAPEGGKGRKTPETPAAGAAVPQKTPEETGK